MEAMKGNGRLRVADGLAIVDEPGQLRMLNKMKLKIDPSYQRGSKSNQRKIADNWSWSCFGAINVAERDGEFFIVDGQQRHGASMLRREIAELPCVVQKTAGAAEEAGVFLTVNTVRTRVSPCEAFVARVTNGEPAAVKVDAHLRSREYTMVAQGFQRKDKTVCAVGLLLKEMERDDNLLRRCFDVAVRITANGYIDKRLIGGLCCVERRLAGTSRSLNQDRYANALVAAGAANVLRELEIAEAACEGQKEIAWGEVIIWMINDRVQARDRIRSSPIT